MSDELRDLYQEVILDHGRHPRNFRHPADCSHHASGHNPLCGDSLSVFLTVDAEGRIADAAFQGHGCAISVASASLMTEVLRGKTRAQAEALFAAVRALATGEDSAAPPGLEDEMERLAVLGGVRAYPVRIKCATLAWHVLDAALDHRDTASTE